MLERTDRLALAVDEVTSAIETFHRIFDCEIVGDGADAEAGARRVTLQWGQDQLELLEPSGPGPVADFLKQGRRGIFAGGFALADPDKAVARFLRRNQSGIYMASIETDDIPEIERRVTSTGPAGTGRASAGSSTRGGCTECCSAW
jgi:hypothetical protein